MKKFFFSRWTKALLFLICLVPAAILGWDAWNQDLGANPIEFITHFTGDWTLRFVLITLAITPLRSLLRQPQLVRFRRMLGLFAFFYGTLHFATWIWIDKDFVLVDMWQDVLKRPFITVGFTGFILMAPLALTSTAGWVRRLGYKRWQKIHRLIYVTGLAAVIHYYWLVKSDVRLPLMYAAVLLVLMSYRVVMWLRKRAPTPRPVAVGKS